MPRQKQRSSKVTFDANFRLPYDLTPHFLSRFKPIPSHKARYLKNQMLSKFVSSDTAPAEVRRTAAINKWLATERNNEATNDRLLTVDPEYNILPRVGYATFMAKVARYVADVIGEVVPGSTDDCWVPGSWLDRGDLTLGSFSAGATTSRPRKASQPAGKYTGKADVTERCWDLAEAAFNASPAWSRVRDFRAETRLVEGNVLFTVPKDTKIDRCACKEPDLNMYFQKAVGDFIRRRLRQFGIDLNDQSRNRSLARIGSGDGSLATIDLSSASDSICYELVAQSVSPFWLSHLDDIRSPVTIIDGERHVCQMFSSMGNGFTFELESLLFWAIARAVAYYTGTSGVISVYGDDIIVPSPMCQDLLWVLAFLGFTPNKDKTFSEGPFRESCGGHYYGAVDITPFYIREPISKLSHVITLANNLRKWCGVDHDGVILDPEVEDCWQWLAGYVPKCFWGGTDLGDSSRLVSFWKPNTPKRLTPINSDLLAGAGGYVYWLNSRLPKVNQSLGVVYGDSLITSSYTSSSGRYRSTRVGWDYRWVERVFPAELECPDPGT